MSFIKSVGLNYLYGSVFVPFVPLSMEITTTVGKVAGLVKETLLQHLYENFQSVDSSAFDDKLPVREKLFERIACRQLGFFLSNQKDSFIEEIVFRTGIQYGLLTLLPNLFLEWNTSGFSYFAARRIKKGDELKFYERHREIIHRVSRIALTSILFGLAHWESDDVIKEKSLLQVIGNMGAGAVYGTVYELAGQNLFAAWGVHAAWNILYDTLTHDIYA